MIREAWRHVAAFYLAFSRTAMLIVLWDGWRPVAYAVGWEAPFKDGTPGAHLERVWVSPRQRGSWRLLKKLRPLWSAECQRRGIRFTLTPIEKSRPAVVELGVRLGGYVYYGEDEHRRWFYLDSTRAS